MLLLVFVIGGAFALGYSVGRRRSAPGAGGARRGQVGWEAPARERIDDARIVRDIDPERRG